MTASKRKPRRAKPVLAWCIVDQFGGYALWTIRANHDAFTRLPHERIARVEIREVAPKRRKRGGT